MVHNLKKTDKKLYKLVLRIADISIQLSSKFKWEPLLKAECTKEWKFNNFIRTRALKRPDISINVHVTEHFPEICDNKSIFITNHFEDDKVDWRLIKNDRGFIYKTEFANKKRLFFINKDFTKVNVYFLPKEKTDVDNYKDRRIIKIKQEFIEKHGGFVWNLSDIIYDFLQVLLIIYLAKKKSGIFVHGLGLENLGRGYLFIGKSGAGKSTMAKIWHESSKAMILNDDRIIIRRIGARFFIYSSPWHGDYIEYLRLRVRPAVLKKIFFIHHSPDNNLKVISRNKSFSLLYPNLFPTFWDKNDLANVISFCSSLVKNVPCLSLGFKNNVKVIKFISEKN